MCYKNRPKVGHFAGFCYCCLETTSVHMLVYSYPLFKSVMKTGFVNNCFMYVGKIEYYLVNTKEPQ